MKAKSMTLKERVEKEMQEWVIPTRGRALEEIKLVSSKVTLGSPEKKEESK